MYNKTLYKYFLFKNSVKEALSSDVDLETLAHLLFVAMLGNLASNSGSKRKEQDSSDV